MFNPLFDRHVCLYDYTVAGSDKAAIDTQVDDGGNGALALPTVYRLLEVWIVARTDDAGASGTVHLTLNNDGGGNYDRQRITGADATASAGAVLGATSWPFGAHGSGGGASYPWVLRVSIPAYGGTTFFKTAEASDVRPDSTAGNNAASLFALAYRSTAAVSRVKIAAAGTANLKVGSRLMVFAR